jgi:carbamoyltransferase
VAANVKMNQRIHDVPGVRNIYVHPNMGDGGCGTGAAILKFLEQGVRPQRLEHAFLGPDYSEQEMAAELDRAGITYTRHENIEDEVARLIAGNFVVGRFDGRMEYGPRALGNRSILYPAQDPDVNQWLNTRLGRTEFMPFAPATLNEDRHRCYKNLDGADFAAQFMTVTFDCTPWMRETCPAAVHVDGTARPQLVTPQSNPSFYKILQAYKQRTGIPSVINTSFNMHEEPIVCTPYDAIRAFQLGRLDYLAMGNFLARADAAAEQASHRKAHATGAS